MAEKQCNFAEIRQFFDNYGKIIKSDPKMMKMLEHVKEQWDDLSTGVIKEEFKREISKGVYENEPSSYGILSSLIDPDKEAEMMTREFGTTEQPPEGNVRKYFTKVTTKKLKPLKFLDIGD